MKCMDFVYTCVHFHGIIKHDENDKGQNVDRIFMFGNKVEIVETEWIELVRIM